MNARSWRRSRAAALVVVLVVLLHVGIEHADAFFGGGSNPAQGTSDNIDYYAVLELGTLREDASERDIKQAFRRLSRQFHPDVAKSAADKERYAKINRAYEVLSNKRKRKMYDMRGGEGLEQLEKLQRDGPNAGRHPFEQLFGMDMGSNMKGRDMEVKVEVSLAYMFSGGTVPLSFSKQKVCTKCKGSGAERDSPIITCPHCRGQGVVVQRMQVGPGMFQTFQETCPHCRGAGSTAKHTCKACGGKRVVHGEVHLEVALDAGTPEGHKVTFEMEAEESPDRIPGDLIVSLFSSPHPLFSRRRNGLDLDTKIEITLKEALLGFEKSITHLDDTEKVLIRRAGVVTPFGTVIKIVGKGMPRLHLPSERGDLYVTVEFSLPHILSAEQRAAVEKLL